MPTGRFPVIVLNLTIPPRGSRRQRPSLQGRGPLPPLRRSLPPPLRHRPPRPRRLHRNRPRPPRPPNRRPVLLPLPTAPAGKQALRPRVVTLGAGGGPPADIATDDRSEPAPGLRSPVMRPLGQVDSTYVVAAGPRGLYLIDQHAAHERILFERLGHTADAPTQQLLDPTSVELSAEESDWVASHADDLQRLGFDVTPFGPSAWLLRAVPSALGRIDAATYLREVVAEAQTPDFQRLAAADRLRWSLACRAAVKAGGPLTFDEMSCPHPRPRSLRPRHHLPPRPPHRHPPQPRTPRPPIRPHLSHPAKCPSPPRPRPLAPPSKTLAKRPMPPSRVRFLLPLLCVDRTSW